MQKSPNIILLGNVKTINKHYICKQTMYVYQVQYTTNIQYGLPRKDN